MNATLMKKWHVYSACIRGLASCWQLGRNTGSEHQQEHQAMNEDRIQGKWKQLKGSIQEKWGKLTNDDLDVVEGNTEYLSGKIQERYGIAKDEAEKAVKEYERTV
jgi:uncharacterized protein YjbJ (UPF0337 family)